MASDAMNGGNLLFLDLPVGSRLCLDGRPIVLQREDFVGFTNVPLQDASAPQFHLVTIRAALQSNSQGDPACCVQSNQSSTRAAPPGPADTNSATAAAVTVGFVVHFSQDNMSSSVSFIRRYDPRTEEVSSRSPIDENSTTINKILLHLQENRIDPRRVLDYRQIVTVEKGESWMNLSKLISQNLIQKRGLQSGDKVVPGSFEEDKEFGCGESSKIGMKQKNVGSIESDGKSIQYPSIPVVMHSRNNQLQQRNDYTKEVLHSKHEGTRKFMANLSPSERTFLFTCDHPSSQILDVVLQQYYQNRWRDLLGDVQLSYLLFLHLNCYSSFCHWRDMVAMLSSVSARTINKYCELYVNFAELLRFHMVHVEEEFLEDSDLTEGNFLVPSLQQLMSTMGEISSTSDHRLAGTLEKLKSLLSHRFPRHFNDATDGDDLCVAWTPSQGGANDDAEMLVDGCDQSDEDDEEDGPVVVECAEIEASLDRSSVALKAIQTKSISAPLYPPSIRQEYPFLFAAMMPNEDILMTCARALDEATDVSLVREAAAYLENVEASKN